MKLYKYQNNGEYNIEEVCMPSKECIAILSLLDMNDDRFINLDKPYIFTNQFEIPGWSFMLTDNNTYHDRAKKIAIYSDIRDQNSSEMSNIFKKLKEANSISDFLDWFEEECFDNKYKIKEILKDNGLCRLHLETI